jgi:hypothetical protein
MEELERKNNTENQQMTPGSRFQEFPLLRGGIDILDLDPSSKCIIKMQES